MKENEYKNKSKFKQNRRRFPKQQRKAYALLSSAIAGDR